MPVFCVYDAPIESKRREDQIVTDVMQGERDHNLSDVTIRARSVSFTNIAVVQAASDLRFRVTTKSSRQYVRQCLMLILSIEYLRRR